MLKVIQETKNPLFLVITPLKPNDKISKETKISIKRNRYAFDWISYEGDNNIPTNTQLAMFQWKYIPYIIKIDNDINAERGMLDSMYLTLSHHLCSQNVAYVYPYFDFLLENGRKISFPFTGFNSYRLLSANYISSNSMIKRDLLDKVGGFVTDQKYERLLDWALWLRFLYYGYVGTNVNKYFSTPLNKEGISNRGQKDYELKAWEVKRDFVDPIKEKFSVHH